MKTKATLKALTVGTLILGLGACSSMKTIDIRERINGTVNSSTTVDIQNDTRKDRTYVEHMVKDTTIREHLEVKKYSYELASTSRVHTYVRIKMPLETFDRLIAEAKVQ